MMALKLSGRSLLPVVETYVLSRRRDFDGSILVD